MSKASYLQRGESLDYVNETTGIIEANTVISLEGRIGVVGTDINPGERGSLHVTGVYEIAKTSRAAINMGATVYFDGTGITDTAANGVMAGYAAQASAAADEVILVKLMG